MPKEQYFRLIATTEPAAVTAPVTGVVEIPPLQAEGVMGERPLLFTKDNGLKLEQRNYAYWTDPPPAMLRDQLIAYLRAAKPYAVLCLPLVSQGHLTGLLYLENNLAQVTFSDARVDLLRILAAQAATALENALLLQRIQEATEKVHRTNEVLEAQVGERTTQLQRSNSDLQAANERLQVELAESKRALQASETNRQAAAQSAATITRLQQQLAEAEAEKESLRRQNGALRDTIDQLNNSVSFRLGMGATAPLRWISRKVGPSGS